MEAKLICSTVPCMKALINKLIEKKRNQIMQSEF